MISREYTGEVCDAEILDTALQAAGLAKGVRFFGVSVSESPKQVIIHVADDFTLIEGALVDLYVHRACPALQVRSVVDLIPNGLVPLNPPAGVTRLFADPTSRAPMVLRDSGASNPMEAGESHVPFFTLVSPVAF